MTVKLQADASWTVHDVYTSTLQLQLHHNVTASWSMH